MNNLNSLFEKIRRYKNTYKNWMEVMFDVRRGKEFIKCELRNGERIELPYNLAWFVPNYHLYLGVPLSSIADLANSGIVEFEYNELSLKFNPGQSGLLAIPLLETFYKNDYEFLKPEGFNVVDIGANIGDTPIYFAIKGAKKVVALEPYPSVFNLAYDNIRMNNLGSKIVLLNAGYGIQGSMEVEDRVEKLFLETSVHSTHSSSSKIMIYSLKALLEKFELINSNELLLKVDCEGCEYQLLNEEPSAFAGFRRVQIEYHYGYENLSKLFSGLGFTVRNTKPKKTFNPDYPNPYMNVGYIYAERD